jgi:hypothetical protein
MQYTSLLQRAYRRVVFRRLSPKGFRGICNRSTGADPCGAAARSRLGRHRAINLFATFRGPSTGEIAARQQLTTISRNVN